MGRGAAEISALELSHGIGRFGAAFSLLPDDTTTGCISAGLCRG